MNENSLLSTEKLFKTILFSFLLLLGLLIFSCNSKSYPKSTTIQNLEYEAIERAKATEGYENLAEEYQKKYLVELTKEYKKERKRFNKKFDKKQDKTKQIEAYSSTLDTIANSILYSDYFTDEDEDGTPTFIVEEPAGVSAGYEPPTYSSGSSYTTVYTTASSHSDGSVSTMSNGSAAVRNDVKTVKAVIKKSKKNKSKDALENKTSEEISAESNEAIPVESVDDSSCFKEKYGKGLVAFDTIPDKMIKDEQYSFKIKIDHMHNLEETIEKIKQKEGIDVEYNVKDLATKRGLVIGSKGMLPLGNISKYVNFVVTADDPEAFSIIDRYEVGFQEIDCVKPAIWQYDITPLKEGKHKVYFNVYLSDDGKTPIPHEGGKEKIIDVEIIKAEESFLTKYTLPLSGGFLGLVFLGLFLFKRRKRLAEKEVITSAITESDLLKMETLVEKGEVDKALSLMTKKIPDHTNKIRQEALLCLRNYNKLTKNYSMNIVSFEDYSQQSSTLSLAVIQLISELKSTLTNEDV